MPQDDRLNLDRQYEGVSLYRLETPDGECRFIIASSMLEALRKYEAHMLSRELQFEDPEEVICCAQFCEVIA